MAQVESPWRGDRVAEGARLESVCAGNRTGGSNPPLSGFCQFLAVSAGV
jgi:hypothetical protein